MLDGARLIATGFSSELASPPEALAAAAPDLKVEIAHTPEEALDLALSGEGPAPHIILCGSLYLAGEVLALNGTPPT